MKKKQTELNQDEQNQGTSSQNQVMDESGFPNAEEMTPEQLEEFIRNLSEQAAKEASGATGAGDNEPFEAGASESAASETGANDTASAAESSAEHGEGLSKEAELEAQVAELKDQLLRKAAEMENMRKRLQRERVQIYDQSKAAAIESFLPVNDDLLRTLDALQKSDADQAFLEGIQMISDKFASVLNSFGVEKVGEVGVPFDVMQHEAMMRQKPSDSSVQPDTVLQVLEYGYKIGDRILRHAKVIVSE